ncbi:hypothetical protein ACH5RR_012564 [Cinchona calisaya]|uniref:ERCC4 domain-containing protein n=1 Tax=Cinchona calisaya TaxID=153742 RepID=A0ABD3A8M8_9GENT
MSQPDPVNILSDDDDDGEEGKFHKTKDYPAPQSQTEAVCIDLSTPSPNFPKKKKQRLSDPSISNPSSSNSTAPVFILDDEISVVAAAETTPRISSRFSQSEDVSIVNYSCASSFGAKSTPSIVAETPISELLCKSGAPILRCNRRGDSNFQPSAASLFSDHSSPESRLICLHSDNEYERGMEGQGPDERTGIIVGVAEEFEFSSRSAHSFGEANELHMSVISSPRLNSLEDDCSLVQGTFDDEIDRLERIDKVSEPRSKNKDKEISKKGIDDLIGKGRISKEERLRLKEEKKQQKEQEKLEKAAQKAEVAELKKLQKEKKKLNIQQEKLENAAQKAEAAELKKMQKEKQKWEKGKFAQKSIVAQIDSKIIEMGSIAGQLLTRFGEKGLSYRVTSNPIERSIVWTMTVPEELSQISCEEVAIPYVLLVYEAEEFCNLVTSGTLMDQVSRVKSQYPNHTICFLMNRLMAYINKREQGQYKNPGKYEGWKRPPIEEVLAKLATHFVRVHSRLCFDEAELAEHVVGLTHSLASCQYRKKPTPLSVYANGSLVPKDCPDRDLIKKNTWLKALVAIPKVQPRFAIAIWKKYPSMKSLLSVYMDPRKSVHEKEFLLKDLTTEGLIGDDRRLGEICSKRVYRILMAQCGNIITDDVEHGADFFHHQTS